MKVQICLRAEGKSQFEINITVITKTVILSQDTSSIFELKFWI